MPMMRRGPLDRYPAEWVLRQANAHLVSGSIEFHTDAPTTFYVHDGRVYAAEIGVNLGEPDPADTPIPNEDEARARVISLLSPVLEARAGWYYHDPLGRHAGRGAWVWETASLLLETRTSTHEVQTLAAWTDREVSLTSTPAASVTLSPDAWAVVVALARKASATELRAALGWSPNRLLDALTEMDGCEVLAPAASWLPDLVATNGPGRWPTPPAELQSVPEPALAGPGGQLPPRPDLPAPPVVRADLQPKARRKIPGRRPAGS
jgi:hypothetical protein